MKSIDDVRQFWETNPLFSGEGTSEIGSKEWFEEWERVYINDCFATRMPEAIYTRGLKTDSRILDVGCGPGFWVRHFLKKGFRNVTACDLTTTAVSLAKRSLELYSLSGASIVVGNAEALPFESGKFDHVNCQGVIHHTPDTASCIREFHRVLAPGGTACFSVYHKNFVLRSPKLLRIISTLFSGSIKLEGRGRDQLLADPSADEIVRRYDGINNPVGKCFTRMEMEKMCSGVFRIAEKRLFFFPARALPFKINKKLHEWLHDNFGLLIVFRCERLPDSGG
jgi:ubiquinone/menaquinone biosynthesis C-methylase UbiE